MALLLAASVQAAEPAVSQPDNYCSWKAKDFAIEQPLCGLEGDVERGFRIATDVHRGNCIACHVLPVSGLDDHGNIGPSLIGVGSRYTEGQLRLRIVSSMTINPYTIMPAFYMNPRQLNRLADRYWDKTLLTAQQVEDVLAWLASLEEENE